MVHRWPVDSTHCSEFSVFVHEGQSGRVFPKCVDCLWCDMWPGGRDGGRENCDMVRIYSGISHDIWSEYTLEYRTIYGQNKDTVFLTSNTSMGLPITRGPVSWNIRRHKQTSTSFPWPQPSGNSLVVWRVSSDHVYLPPLCNPDICWHSKSRAWVKFKMNIKALSNVRSWCHPW